MDVISGRRKEEDGYRRGVLLGLTVAEIITLILFALLLALWGQISKLRTEVERASIISKKFSSLIESAQEKSSKDLAAELEKIIKAEINYAAKLAAELEKYKNNLLPDEVFDLIKSQNFDLRKAEDREKFFALTKLAATLASQAGQPIQQMADRCTAGARADAVLKGADPEKVISDRDHWRQVASTCGKGSSLPPCYSLNGKEALIFEARLSDDGILLKDIVPDSLRDRFNKDFPTPPNFGEVLSRRDFRTQTSQFVDYGRRNECRFRVDAFDDTGQDKRNFQIIEKVLDSVFYRNRNW